MAFAQITIIGNLGGDPEMRYTPNGKAVTDFNVAVSHSKPDGRGGWTEDTNWFKVSVWGKFGETIVEKYRKGDRILVSGRFKAREYTARDGRKGTALEITGDSVEFALRPPKEGNDGSFSAPAPRDEPSAPPVKDDPDDDLPF